MRQWYGVDLDGTLAKTSRGSGIGAPVERMVDRVQRLLDKGKEVRIVTARVSTAIPLRKRHREERRIREWCWDNLGTELPVQAEKDHRMKTLYDDRAKRVERNTGRIAPKRERSLP